MDVNYLKKNKCKFIVIPCNTAHYWFDDLQKKNKNSYYKYAKRSF